jgi:tight adherence protein B
VAWKAVRAQLDSDEVLQARVAKILKVAGLLGAPVVPAIERAIEVELHRQSAVAELEAEFAAPKATARLVAWLPFGFLAVTQLMGLPIFQALQQSLLAKVSIGLGVALLVIARMWSRKILKAASPSQLDVTENLELVAIALHAGVGFSAALQKVRAPADTAALLAQERLLARTSGAPVAGLIEARADAIRAKQARADRIRIREASIKLMWPLGAAVLPALILMLVVPLAAGFAGGLGV